jgi:regulator of cell morphogenesis and NO signaling
MDLIQELLDDHTRLRDALRDLAKTYDPERAASFAADIGAHARLEDELLFRELERELPAHGGPLAVMRAEHEEIEALTGALTAGDPRAVERLERVAADHFLKEENVLFAFARRLVDSERLAALGAAYRHAMGPSPALEPEVGAETRVADLARRWPATIRVFQRHGIDFCCGGKLPLAAACVDRGLPVEGVLGEVRQAIAVTPEGEESWSQRPVAEIVGHVLARYHAGLRDELERLRAMSERAAERHGAAHPELLETRALVTRLKSRMVEHLDLEERVLFPALLAGVPSPEAAGLEEAEAEHVEVGELLARLRAATGGFAAPADACNTWRGLYHGLAELERDTHLHVHLENNVLFPKVAV